MSTVLTESPITPEEAFAMGWNGLAQNVHNTAREKGWWDPPQQAVELMDFLNKSDISQEERFHLLANLEKLSDRNDAEMLALFHSEISELLEGLRKHNPPSEKIPEYSCAEEEAADLMIRLMDTAIARGWNIPGAVLAKMSYNANRSYRHGGKTC